MEIFRKNKRVPGLPQASTPAAAGVAAGVAALVVTLGSPTSEGMLDLGGYARFFTLLFMVITLLTCLFLT